MLARAKNLFNLLIASLKTLPLCMFEMLIGLTDSVQIKVERGCVGERRWRGWVKHSLRRKGVRYPGDTELVVWGYGRLVVSLLIIFIVLLWQFFFSFPVPSLSLALVCGKLSRVLLSGPWLITSEGIAIRSPGTGTEVFFFFFLFLLDPCTTRNRWERTGSSTTELD